MIGDQSLEEKAFEMYSYTKLRLYALQRDSKATPEMIKIVERCTEKLFEVYQWICEGGSK